MKQHGRPAPLTNAERQRRYRARRTAERREDVAEGRTLVHLYCRQLVGDANLRRVAGGQRHDLQAVPLRRGIHDDPAPLPDIRNAALAYWLAGYAPRWSAVLGPKLRARAVRVLGDSLENRAHT